MRTIVHRMHTCFIHWWWPWIDRWQNEIRIAWYLEFVNRKRMHLVQRLTLLRTFLQLLKAFGYVKYQIDQHSIRFVLYFVSFKEHIRFKVEQRLIDYVQTIGHIVRIQACNRSTDFGSKWKQCKITNFFTRCVRDLRVIDL